MQKLESSHTSKHDTYVMTRILLERQIRNIQKTKVQTSRI